MGGWMDGWVDGWMDAWMSAWMGAGGLYDILKLREPPELMVPTAADRVVGAGRSVAAADVTAAGRGTRSEASGPPGARRRARGGHCRLSSLRRSPRNHRSGVRQSQGHRAAN